MFPDTLNFAVASAPFRYLTMCHWCYGYGYYLPYQYYGYWPYQYYGFPYNYPSYGYWYPSYGLPLGYVYAYPGYGAAVQYPRGEHRVGNCLMICQ